LVCNNSNYGIDTHQQTLELSPKPDIVNIVVGADNICSFFSNVLGIAPRMKETGVESILIRIGYQCIGSMSF
jgi:hypothetical protein